jgi:hypothetical protein
VTFPRQPGGPHARQHRYVVLTFSGATTDPHAKQPPIDQMRERARAALLALPSELLALDGNGECYPAAYSERCAAVEQIDCHAPQ